MTPSRIGRRAVMLPGVRPSIIRASSPTATMRGRLPLLSCAIATTDGSVSTIPFPRTYTMTFAVPRSMPIWRANKRRSFQLRNGCGTVSLAPHGAGSGGIRRDSGARGLDPGRREAADDTGAPEDHREREIRDVRDALDERRVGGVT